MLLSEYQVQTRRLLNDSQKNYWTDAELTDYINEARRQTAVDTLCVRKFQKFLSDGVTPITLTPGIEQYQYTDILPLGTQTIDIINISIVWGNSLIQLGWCPFTTFSGMFRQYINYRRTPVAFTVYNTTEFWIAYIPDQAYAAEFDTAILPLNLVNDNTVDSIPVPYSEAVKYFAASLARLKLQQYSEYQAQQKIYEQKIARLGAMPPRRIPYAFENEVF
jgi:hypothetical protein